MKHRQVTGVLQSEASDELQAGGGQVLLKNYSKGGKGLCIETVRATRA